MPATKTGKHRRLRIEEVLAFKRVRDAERARAVGKTIVGSAPTTGGVAANTIDTVAGDAIGDG